jgi:hypothetical protein
VPVDVGHVKVVVVGGVHPYSVVEGIHGVDLVLGDAQEGVEVHAFVDRDKGVDELLGRELII